MKTPWRKAAGFFMSSCCKRALETFGIEERKLKTCIKLIDEAGIATIRFNTVKLPEASRGVFSATVLIKQVKNGRYE